MTANEFGSNLEQLTGRLKTEDSHYAKIIKGVQIMYLIFIPLFAFKTISEYNDSKSMNDIYSGIFLILSFLTFIFAFRKYYKEYKHVDYSLPTLEMLKKAAHRYQPFQKKTIWVFTGLVLMDIGLAFDWLDLNTSLLHTQIIFVGGIILGFIIGIIVWYFKYKPLRDDALKLIREIEE